MNAWNLHFPKTRNKDYQRDRKDTGVTGTLLKVHIKPPERQKTASRGFVNNHKNRSKNHCKTVNKKQKNFFNKKLCKRLGKTSQI